MKYVIYGKDNCPYCNKAKHLLSSKNIDFDYLTMGKDYSREELLELAPDAKTVPQIWLNEEEELIYVGGYEDLEKSLKDPVQNILEEGSVIRVNFTKVDGTIREMLCTQNPEIISQKYPLSEKTKTKEKEKEGVVVVFDLDKNDWRSFRLESVNSFTIVEDVE